MRNKVLKTAMITIMIFLMTTGVAFGDRIYYDVYNHWAEEDIYWASNDVHIFSGYTDWTFKPRNNISRIEYITILHRAVKLQGLIEPDENSETEVKNSAQTDVSIETIDNKDLVLGYTDIRKDNWGGYDAIKNIKAYIDASNSDINFKSIFPGTEFRSNTPITREEAVMVSSFFTSPSIEENERVLKDIDIDYPYYKEIKNMINNGIIDGYPDRTFKPKNEITRGQSAKIIKELFFDMEYLKGNYLQDIQLIDVFEDNRFLDFGMYDYKDLRDEDDQYKTAINTLEYKSFAGFIHPDEEHLYDTQPIQTLWNLKAEGYRNIAGLNYYLIHFDDTLTEKEKLELCQEILDDYLIREDMTDEEVWKIFNLMIDYEIVSEKMILGLNKWHNVAQDKKLLANIKFFQYKWYLINNDKDSLMELLSNNKLLNDLNVNLQPDNEPNTGPSQEETISTFGTLLNPEGDENSQEENTSVTEENRVDIQIVKAEIINNAYIMFWLNDFHLSEDILRKGWLRLQSHPLYPAYKRIYDKEFKGAIKEVLIQREKDVQKIENESMN